MKIHAFRVSRIGRVGLGSVLERIAAMPLADRLRDVSGTKLRLEDASRLGAFWLLDFGGIRHEGPGRASIDDPITDFELDDNEGFGHETAMYFDTETDYVTLQYNHFGPRISGIKNYLYQVAQEMFDGDDNVGFNFSPVMKAQAADRLNRVGIVKTVQVSVLIPGIVAAGGGAGRSLGQILDNPLVESAEKLSLKLSVKRNRGSTISLEHVKQFAADLLGFRDNVEVLEIVAKEDDDSPREPIDLLEARLESDIPVPRTGRRHGREARLDALKQSFNVWQENGQFT